LQLIIIIIIIIIIINRTTVTNVPLVIVGKGKAIPVQTWTGPEGSKGSRLLDFMTVGT